MIKKTTISSLLVLSISAGVIFVSGCGKPEATMKDEGMMKDGTMMKDEGMMKDGTMMKDEGMMKDAKMGDGEKVK